MKLLIAIIAILMFCATVYSVNTIVESGKVENTGLITKGNCLTNAACFSIAVIAAAYDVAGAVIIYLLV